RQHDRERINNVKFRRELSSEPQCLGARACLARTDRDRPCLVVAIPSHPFSDLLTACNSRCRSITVRPAMSLNQHLIWPTATHKGRISLSAYSDVLKNYAFLRVALY